MKVRVQFYAQLRDLTGIEQADIDLAVKAARRAFDSGPWAKMSASERGRIIWKIGDLLAENIEEFAELDEYWDMPVNTYSAGMRARLAFGACLGIDFDVYLIDEVTEIGDERFRRKCVTAFRERMRRSDIILVTHNTGTIRQYCNRAAVLSNGRLELFENVSSALDAHRRQSAEPQQCG